MIHRRVHSARSGRFPRIWIMGALLVSVCVVLAGCDEHFLSLDCIGASGICGPVAPTPNATALTTAAQTVTQSKPLVTDPLSKQDAYKWAIDVGCAFHDGAYVVKFSGKTDGTYVCTTNKLTYRDLALAVDVTLISGNSAGIMFRTSFALQTAYMFLVSATQFWVVEYYHTQVISYLIPPTTSSAVHGLTQTNRLLAIARGNDFQFFINGVFVGEATDNVINVAGTVGVNVGYNPRGEAHFANLAIYHV